ncbi:MAG: hypothetical protein JWR69_4616 [Pedosphaera sp.]|nr:hypothetical protein [Pedosphaera sp.]
MRKTMDLAGLVLLVAVSGCSTTPKPASVSPTPSVADVRKSDLAMLQGVWKGEEFDGNAGGQYHLGFSGKNLDFRSADGNEWYKGTFTLREDSNLRLLVLVIAEGCEPKYVGKTSYVIYRLEGGTLTIAGNEPGNPEVPAGFDAPDARKGVFKRE